MLRIRTIVSLAVLLSCCGTDPEQGAGRLRGPGVGVLRLDPSARRFELIEAPGSVFACVGSVDDEMAESWADLTAHLLTAPGEGIDGFSGCVVFHPDAGDPSMCRADVLRAAMDLGEMAAAAVTEECGLAAPIDGALITLPDLFFALNANGTVYGEGWVTEPCGTFSRTESELLLERLANESRERVEPGGGASADVFVVDDPRWGDLRAGEFAVSEALTLDLRAAWEATCAP